MNACLSVTCPNYVQPHLRLFADVQITYCAKAASDQHTKLKAAPQQRQLSTLQWDQQILFCVQPVLCTTTASSLFDGIAKVEGPGTKCNPLLQVGIYRSLLDITAGMDYLHSAGVMHGDLKGANVLLKSTATDPRGFQCKLADFGLSRMLDMDMTHISTHTYGTISYMPPELLSQGKMTRAADVYSFGMLSKLLMHYSSVCHQLQMHVCLD